MNNKEKTIIDKIGMVLLCITIVTFNLIIGGNGKPLRILPICIFTGASLVILLIKKIIFKEKIIKNKIDIAVSIFICILILPLLFGTYCSFQGTIEFILKYIFVYSIYLLTRNMVNTKKRINILINTTIISSLIVIILGFDLLHLNWFQWLREALNLDYGVSYRFISTFGYANAASIYIAFCSLLAIDRIENTNKKALKILYCLYAILGTYIIYISYSRVVLIIYILILLGYFCVKAYNKLKNNKKILKRVLLGIVCCIMLFTVYIIIAMNYSKPHEVTEEYSKIYKEFLPNQEYTISFDITVKNENKKKSNCKIQILEVNKYFTETELANEELEFGQQKKEIKIKPSEDVYYIKLKILNKNDKEVIINNCYINGEEYKFAYKYIPSIIARLITTFSLNDESIVLRGQYYENCLRIAKDSPIIGHGGNTWRILGCVYEDYPYTVKESHSYFFELLISYGIVGVIAFLIILVLFIKKELKELVKNKETRKQKIYLFIGLIFMILYNLTFDFGMSFVLIILVTFIYMAILQVSENEQVQEVRLTKTNKIFTNAIDYMALLSIGIITILLLKYNMAKYMTQDIEAKAKMAPYYAEYNFKNLESNYSDDIEKIKEFMEKEPYQAQFYIYKLYWNAVCKKANTLTQQELKDHINYGIEVFKNVKQMSPMYFITVTERVRVMANVVKDLQKIESVDLQDEIQQLKDIMLEEYKVNEKNIKDTKRNNKTQKECEQLLKNYELILESLNIKIN